MLSKKRPVTLLYERHKRPGTISAFKSGCTCSIIDNHYGKGYRGDGSRWGWVMSETCPIHGSKEVTK
jgi:hypothetical protein